jgi:hypothetical protein
MGGLRKRDVETMIHMVSFVIGGTDDPDLDLKVAETDEPMGGLPAWKPGKRIRYLNVWKDIMFDEMPGTGVARILMIFRKNRGTYDKPRFFQINDYGIFEFEALTEKKEVKKQTIEAGTNKVKDEKIVRTGPFDHRWEVCNEWPFYCEVCGRQKKRCVCDQVYLLEHLSIYQADEEQDGLTHCGKLMVPELYEYENERITGAEVRLLCEDCGEHVDVDIDLAEKVHRLYGDIDAEADEEQEADA